ncbi:MAG: SIS domain-containing protein [Paracoccaceae bacterium]
MSHSASFFKQSAQIAQQLPHESVEKLAFALASLKEKRGRLFVLGVGGSAGNCSHAVNDFRKLCDIEAYAPVDNVSELTARVNDDGWETVFENWMKVSNATEKDAILILSVGGGDKKRNISPNIVKAVDYAKKIGMEIYGILGMPNGHTATNGDIVIVVPSIDSKFITPQSEAFQAVVWHCLVSHPALQTKPTKW